MSMTHGSACGSAVHFAACAHCAMQKRTAEIASCAGIVGAEAGTTVAAGRAMSALVSNLMQAVRLRGVFPVRVIIRTVRQNLVAYASARVALRACDRVGLRARTFGRPKLVNHGEIRIGDDFAVGGALGPVHIATGPMGVVTIGDDVAIDYGTSISARTHVSLGSGVRIGPYCILSDADLPLPLDLSEDDDARAIILGEDVRLGARVTVMPGVRIGERAMVTAGSVVTRDVPDDAVMSGNPASVMRIAPRSHPYSRPQL